MRTLDDIIDELRRLNAARTPGPYRVVEFNRDGDHPVKDADRSFGLESESPAIRYWDSSLLPQRDAEFLAAVSNNVELLCATIRSLQMDYAALDAKFAGFRDGMQLGMQMTREQIASLEAQLRDAGLREQELEDRIDQLTGRLTP